MAIKFPLQSVEYESTLAVASRLSLSDDLERALLCLCEGKFTAPQCSEVQRTLSFVKSLQSYISNYPSLRIYLSHPVRVATLALEMLPESHLETVSIGLLHNVLEICGLKEEDLKEAGYSAYISQAIRLLTIDRTLEENHEYLTGFYEKIEAFGENLSLIRCADKLDNLLALQLCGNDNARARYLDLAQCFVTPMAHRLSTELGEYFEKVIAYMRVAGCKPYLVAQYKEFVKEHSASRSCHD